LSDWFNSQIDPSINELFDAFIDLFLIDWSIDWLIDFIDRWIDWLIDADLGIEDALDIENASVFCAGVTQGSDEGSSLLTSGGRVLTVVATACDVKTAADRAQLAARAVNFAGKTYRTDIALKALKPPRSVIIARLITILS